MLPGGMIEKVKIKRKKNHTEYLRSANYQEAPINL